MKNVSSNFIKSSRDVLEVFYFLKLKPEAIMLYQYLEYCETVLTYNSSNCKFYRTYKQIEADTGLKKRRIIQALSVLKSDGFINIGKVSIRLPNGKHSNRHFNQFEIVDIARVRENKQVVEELLNSIKSNGTKNAPLL